MLKSMMVNYFKTKKLKNNSPFTLVFGLKNASDDFFITVGPGESKPLVEIAGFLKIAKVELVENELSIEKK